MENNYTQLCVWPGTVLGDSTKEDFENFILEEFDTRIQYHTEVKTLPDLNEDGTPVPDTGNRNDLFFYVHSEDVTKFAVPRLRAGIRWWEDVIGSHNNNRHLYTQEFLEQHPPTW
jgi:hypothetical protein